MAQTECYCAHPQCTALTGNPLPALRWLTDSGQEVSDQEAGPESQDEVSHTMTLTLDKEHNGKTFTCEAKEDKKKGAVLLTRDIVLAVQFLPDKVTITQPDKLVENQAANFSCSSGPSNPGLKIVWHWQAAGRTQVGSMALAGGWQDPGAATLLSQHSDSTVKVLASSNTSHTPGDFGGQVGRAMHHCFTALL